MRIRDRLVVCVSGYQDYKGLKLLLDQITPYVWKVIYVDGRYDFFRLGSVESLYSTDGSLELCQDYDNVILIKYAGYQPDKRQQYVNKAEELGAKVLIVIDTDEWIHPDFQDWNLFYDKLEEQIDLYGRFHRLWNLMIYVEEGYELAYNAVTRDSWSIGSGRIWYRPEELEYYAGVHYFVRRRDTSDPHERLMSTDKTINEGIRLRTSSMMRSNEFKMAREKWAKDGMDYEEKLINSYNWLVSNTKERQVTTNPPLYPLIAVMSNMENKDREKGIISSNKNVDTLFIKHNPSQDIAALSAAFKYFRTHAGYTHLVLTTFDMNWSYEQFMMLYNPVKQTDYTILSGYTMNDNPYNTLHGGIMLKPDSPSANFTLPNENNIKGDELHSRPTGMDIATYVKLYRQTVLPVATLDDFPLMFVRNDIVKYIDEINTPQYDFMSASEALSKRLQYLGIMQYVHLNCCLDRVRLNFPTVFQENISCELTQGKYEAPVNG